MKSRDFWSGIFKFILSWSFVFHPPHTHTFYNTFYLISVTNSHFREKNIQCSKLSVRFITSLRFPRTSTTKLWETTFGISGKSKDCNKWEIILWKITSYISKQREIEGQRKQLKCPSRQSFYAVFWIGIWKCNWTPAVWINQLFFHEHCFLLHKHVNLSQYCNLYSVKYQKVDCSVWWINSHAGISCRKGSQSLNFVIFWCRTAD